MWEQISRKNKNSRGKRKKGWIGTQKMEEEGDCVMMCSGAGCSVLTVAATMVTS